MQLLTSQVGAAASGNSGVIDQHFETLTTAIFLLDVTSAGSVAGDKLDVYAQSSIDEGATWDDFIHFAQIAGNGGAVKRLAYWTAIGQQPTTPEKAPQDAALAAGVQLGPLGKTWRVKWVITNGGGTHLFTFSVGVQQYGDL